MNKILEQIKSPDWWFTAVFIAIVASIVAAFAKDWISNILASLSNRFKAWKTNKENFYEKEAEFLTKSHTLLIVEHIRASVLGLMAMLASLIFSTTPLLIRFNTQFPSEGELRINKITYEFVDRFYPWFGVLSGLFLLWMMYHFYDRMEICLRARRKLRKKVEQDHGSNPLPPTSPESES